MSRPKKKKENPTFIDLFAGAGGMSEGFVRAKFNPVAHVEIEEAACNTLRTRQVYHYLKSKSRKDEYVSYLKGEITREELYALAPKEELDKVINLPIGAKHNEAIFSRIDAQLGRKKTVDVIIGGPPCQAYSLVGRARDKNGMKDDMRNFLYLDYIKFLVRYKPKFFVFENVLGLKSANGGKYLKDMKEKFNEAGYLIKEDVYEAKNFGVLQNRKRIIIVGWKKSMKISPPSIVLPLFKKEKVAKVLNDLPVIGAGEGEDKFQKYRTATNEYLQLSEIRNGINVLTQHVARPNSKQDLEIYRRAVQLWNDKQERIKYTDLPSRLITHNNTATFLDRFKVVAADMECSQTVVAHIAKDGHHYIHPDIEQNRSLSVREAARLQSFPDDYYFEGVKDRSNRTAAYKQIGNAVPPLMATAIAQNLKSLNK